MKAAVLWEVNRPLRVEELTLDAPKQGEVLVKIAAAGICHSDYHFMRGDLPIGIPCVLGHEGAGVVEEIGPGVARVRPGEGGDELHAHGIPQRQTARNGARDAQLHVANHS